MKQTLLNYLRQPGTWAGIVAAIAGAVSTRYGHPAGDVVSQLLLLGGGVMIGVPR